MKAHALLKLVTGSFGVSEHRFDVSRMSGYIAGEIGHPFEQREVNA